MANPLKNDLESLVKEGIINTDIADRIRQWYTTKNATNPNRLILIFSVLGSLLVCSGIILLLAHNWDDFSRPVKLFFAFLPLLAGQLAVGFTLFKKRDNIGWREVSGSWLALSIGCSIALVSQIYHLPGSIPDFLLTWLLLGGLLIYILPSSVVAVLFVAGATWYAVEAGYSWIETGWPPQGWPYWPMMAFVLLHYYRVVKENPAGFFAQLFHYVFPVSLLIGLGMHTSYDGSGFLWMAFSAMLGIFLLLGLWFRQKEIAGWWNGYHVLGGIGTLALLLAGTFRDFWREMAGSNSFSMDNGGYLVFAIWLFLLFCGIGLYVYTRILNRQGEWHALSPGFVIFSVLGMLASYYPGMAAILANLYVLLVGVWLVLRGHNRQHFARLNAGLGIIALLAICRFFDTDLSFVLRGVIFIAVGLGFVLANYQLIQKKKTV